MDSSLLGSPHLGWDEKHTKEREHARIFQQVHHTQQLFESICEAIRQLPSNQRAKREREFDVADFYTVIPCSTRSAIEAQFQHVYTYKKFREFQAQFRGKVPNSTFKKFLVTYDVVSREVKCQCLLFKSRGILCRYFLSVLSFEQVDNVAPKYILERWIKNIKRRHTHIKSNQDESLLELRSKRFDDLVFRSHNICKFASESEELTGILHRVFENVMAEMQEYQARCKRKSSLSHEEATLSEVNDLQSSARVRTRDRSKNRHGSNLEKKISNATKKKKRPTPSELNLLDGRPAIQPSSSFHNAPDMNYSGEDYTSFY
ncbi:hypothetical protein Ahy_B04g070315 [Arachis hypogaea]|uniref:Protein FAR1-RELATED SEQUENCE n=1 Tax=Arachis hypogaea TaxID=3818 RepID=A0A444ZG94_ARAHY|nr:hypothetical protein Ahy_B04g070315 [Arachis hypogaea]